MRVPPTQCPTSSEDKYPGSGPNSHWRSPMVFNPRRLTLALFVKALHQTAISKMQVLDPRVMTSSLLTFHSSKTLVSHAVVAILLSFGISSLFGYHRAEAEAVADVSLPKLESHGSIAWHSCGKDLDCAEVRVPLDWNHPDGPKISLSVARHRASKTNERIGSLFVNFGGPGVPGVPAVLAGGRRSGPVGWRTV